MYESEWVSEGRKLGLAQQTTAVPFLTIRCYWIFHTGPLKDWHLHKLFFFFFPPHPWTKRLWVWDSKVILKWLFGFYFLLSILLIFRRCPPALCGKGEFQIQRALGIAGGCGAGGSGGGHCKQIHRICPHTHSPCLPPRDGPSARLPPARAGMWNAPELDPARGRMTAEKLTNHLFRQGALAGLAREQSVRAHWRAVDLSGDGRVLRLGRGGRATQDKPRNRETTAARQKRSLPPVEALVTGWVFVSQIWAIKLQPPSSPPALSLNTLLFSWFNLQSWF